MEKSIEMHLIVAKMILEYLNETLEFGLKYIRDKGKDLVSYSNNYMLEMLMTIKTFHGMFSCLVRCCVLVI